MKEYFSDSAGVYQQTNGKHSLLFPAISRHLPKFDGEGLLLDVGCGTGDIFSLAQEKGYRYYGLDISPDMLDRARKEYPEGTYLQADSTDFSKKYNCQFDAVVINMLFPALSDPKSLAQTLVEARKIIKSDGTLIVGIPHPCFDQYMQSGLLGKEGVETDFQGYFQSGTKFLIYKQMGKGTMVFEDFHWTLGDYISGITQAGFSLAKIDECKPIKIPIVRDDFIQKKSRFPTYMVLIGKP